MARFIARCAMRWSDMDAYGHVNNTAYLAYLEQARVSMFFDRYDSTFARRHRGGPSRDHLPAAGGLSPRAAAAGVVDRPDPGADFIVRYDVFDGDTLAAQAATRLVTFDFTTDRPRRLTPEEKAILLGYLDEPPSRLPATSRLMLADRAPLRRLRAAGRAGAVGRAGRR